MKTFKFFVREFSPNVAKHQFIIEDVESKEKAIDLFNETYRMNFEKFHIYYIREIKTKLHPAIIHINCGPNLDNEQIDVINKMVDLVSWMTGKEIKQLAKK